MPIVVVPRSAIGIKRAAEFIYGVKVAHDLLPRSDSEYQLIRTQVALAANGQAPYGKAVQALQGAEIVGVALLLANGSVAELQATTTDPAVIVALTAGTVDPDPFNSLPVPQQIADLHARVKVLEGR